MNNDDMLERFDMPTIGEKLEAEAYAVLPAFFNADESCTLANLLDAARVTLGPEGGEFHYFDDAMPLQLRALCESLYRWLVPLANRWNKLSGIDRTFSRELEGLLEANLRAGQHRQQSHVCRLREGDRVGLHRHDEGEWGFPFQIVALLSEPKRDFTGGEFVMTEQRPRMQSRPMVVPLQAGDMAIIASAQRPIQGTHGYYRGHLKHAISRVRSGERVGLELIFHQAA
jgi:uncharacterized protein